MTAHRDPDRLIQAFLDEGRTELSDRAYDAVRAEIDHTRQWAVLGLWRQPRVSNYARFAIVAVAILAVVAVGAYVLPRLGGIAAPAATPTAEPSATAASPTAKRSPTLNATLSPTPTPVSAATPSPLLRTYVTTPFAPTAEVGTICFDPPQPGCSESPEDDSIRITYTIPDGWSAAPLNSIWLASEHNSGPAGAGVIAVRGGWLHRDPCLTGAAPPGPDISTGHTVDDFANALAEHPLLEVSAPVDVTLAGFDGKYVDLQAPSDISGCGAYFPWEPGIYAQGPGHRWHLWILDVDGVRVVIQATEYAGTSPEHQAELQAIVDSIQIDPGTADPVSTASPVGVSANDPANGWIAYSTMPRVEPGGGTSHDGLRGGDIYVVREGVQPVLVEGRGEGMNWNVCPVFSPDGTMLAFGQRTGTSNPPSRAVVVVGVDANGSTTDVVTIPAARTTGPAPCPLWSVDGTRVAFLEERTVVVRGLDGSSPAHADGDPVVGDFAHDEVEPFYVYDEVEPLISPTGDWMVQRQRDYPGACQLAVARSDGSDSRIIFDTQGAFCFYSIAAWSPDGQWVLLMENVGWGFTMHAVSIDPSEAVVTIVSSVRVNDTRSWPGRGDVSWQPVYP